MPFECTSGQNIVDIRKQYPREKAIDKKLDSKVPFMLEHGGYIPTIDHNVPQKTL